MPLAQKSGVPKSGDVMVGVWPSSAYNVGVMSVVNAGAFGLLSSVACSALGMCTMSGTCTTSG